MASASNAGIKTPKSILKKSTETPEDTVAARNRELAIHHALIIQHQKDVEMGILDTIEILIDYPKSSTDPAFPHSSDAQDIKRYLASFRPSDFDSLVQERNLEEKCGYVLCPRPRVKQTTSAKFRLLQGRNLQVVRTSDLEKWCSKECAKRALYLRVQLGESPPWDRAAGRDSQLQLYGEAQAPQADERLDHVTRDLQKLALERGEQSNSFRAKSIGVDLQEKFDDMTIDEPRPPALKEKTAAMDIEGYRYGQAKPRNKDPLALDMIKDSGDILDSL